MTYIVGDIHGEISKLERLVHNIKRRDPDAKFVFIGDYIDKGEDAYKTLLFLEDLAKENECTFLIGNHEYTWLNYGSGDTETGQYLLKYGAVQTIQSLKATSLDEAREKLLNEFSGFFDSLQKYWITESYIVVHSGISPVDYDVPIRDIPTERLLFNRYDFIAQTKLYLDHYKVMFGHTGFYSPYIDEYKIGIDTAACFLRDQPLTAFCVENSQFIDSNNLSYRLNDENFGYCPSIVRCKPWREFASQ